MCPHLTPRLLRGIKAVDSAALLAITHWGHRDIRYIAAVYVGHGPIVLRQMLMAVRCPQNVKEGKTLLNNDENRPQ